MRKIPPARAYLDSLRNNHFQEDQPIINRNVNLYVLDTAPKKDTVQPIQTITPDSMANLIKSLNQNTQNNTLSEEDLTKNEADQQRLIRAKRLWDNLNMFLEGDQEITWVDGEKYPFKTIWSQGVTSIGGVIPNSSYGYIFDESKGTVLPYNTKMFIGFPAGSHLDAEWKPIEEVFSDSWFANRWLHEDHTYAPVQWMNNLIGLSGWNPLKWARKTFFKNGGKMNTQDIQQQIVQLVQAAMLGNKEATLQINQIIAAAKQGDQKAVQLAQMIQAVVQQMQGNSVKAALGAKLNYIQRLKGNCPEGEELVYFKSGGKVDCGCVKKAEGGVKTPQVDKKPLNKKPLNKKIYINPSDTVWADGDKNKPRSLMDSNGKILVPQFKPYSGAEYKRDLERRKKGDKAANERIMKADEHTSYACGGRAKKKK